MWTTERKVTSDLYDGRVDESLEADKAGEPVICRPAVRSVGEAAGWGDTRKHLVTTPSAFIHEKTAHTSTKWFFPPNFGAI